MTENNNDESVDIEILSIHEEKTPVAFFAEGNTEEFRTDFEDRPAKFEIHVADNDISSGAISISWCLTKDLLNELKDAEDPCVVIISSPKTETYYYSSKKEKRKVVRIKDLLAYIDFSSSGENYVFAFIKESFKDAKKEFLSRSGSSWECELLDYEGKKLNSFRANNDRACVPLVVNVPENLFAKPPSQWEQDWVYWLTPRDKAFDQCDFRRKRLFAYTLQIIPFIITLMCRLGILLWSALWLNRGTLNVFKALIHPLQMDLDGVCGLWDKCLFTYYKKVFSHEITDYGERETIKKPVYDDVAQYRYNWFTPIGLIFMFGVFKFLEFGYHLINNWNMFFLVVGVALATAAIFFGITLLVYWLQKKNISPITDEDIDVLICSENKIKSIKDVRNKSIRLRYDDLKNKVCKPFSM